MNPGDAWALAGWSLVAAALVATPVRARLAPTPRAVVVVAVTAALIVAATASAAGLGEDGLTWAAIWRGFAGDPSATLVLLAGWRLLDAAAGRPRPAAAGLDRTVLFAVAAIVGWTLILTHLGSDRWDVYRVGQSGWLLPALCTALALAAAAFGLARCALALAGALAAWGLGLPESTNLWDALVDPWLTLAATAAGLGIAWRAWRRPARRG